MTRFRSGRLTHQHIGISSFTDNKLVLDVIGNTRISGILSVPQLKVTGTDGIIDGDIETRNLTVTGIATFGGPITAGSSEGSPGQFLQRTETGVLWASFPSVRNTQTFVATAGQTTFSFVYNTQFVDVYLNGVKLSGSEYDSSSGSEIVLNSGCFAGDSVEIISFNATSLAAGGGAAGVGIQNIVEDTTPQLGGDLDLNGFDISGTGNLNVSGVITATKFVGDGTELTGVISGVGVHSGGTIIGTGVTQLNFVGTGNTFLYNSTTDTVDISISGGGGATGINTEGLTFFERIEVAGLSTFKYNGDTKFETATNGLKVYQEIDTLHDTYGTGRGGVKTGVLTLGPLGNFQLVSQYAGTTNLESNLLNSFTYPLSIRSSDSITFDGPPGANENTTVSVAGVITAKSGYALTYYGSNLTIGSSITSGSYYGDGSTLSNVKVDVQSDSFTNSTFYPLFSDAISGKRTPKTDNDFTYNPASNALTLSVVNANLVGTVNGTLNGNASTASGIVGRPNLDVRSVDATGITVNAGVITSQTFSGNLVGNLTGTSVNVNTATISGDIQATNAVFLGNVSIGGTLTYEDVTNIDSVGIVTARDGIKVLSGGINAVGVVSATSFVGDGSGITGVLRPSIVTDDTAPTSPSDGELWWKSDEGTLKVYYSDVDSGQWVDASPTGGGAGTIEIINDPTPQLGGDLDLYNKNITGTGNVNITGIITSTSLYAADGTFSTNVSIAGIATALEVSVGSATTIDASGIVAAGVVTASRYISNDMLLEGSGGDVLLKNTDASGDLFVESTGGTVALKSPTATYVDGSSSFTRILHNGSLRIETTTSGIEVTGNVSSSSSITAVDFYGDVFARELDVEGHTNLDNVSVSGVTTVTGSIIANDIDVDGHTNLDNVSIAGVTTFSANSNNVVVGGATTALLVDGDLRVTGVGSFGAGSVSIATSAISYTGYGATIGIGTIPAHWGSGIQQNVLELGGEKIHLNAYQNWIGGHLLPIRHEQFDIGSADKKIRHLFLSDNSIWLGDQNKIDTSTGDMKMKKRHIESLPKSITDLGGDGSGAISHANTIFGYSPAKTQLKQLTLQDLIAYLTSLDNTKTEITDLYPSEMIDGNANSAYTDDDWQKINVDATVGSQNPFVTKGFSSPP
tara:strand:+ start:3258 stop:6683 length:3426 start_codon:yes stop_codon:yes gene_type:complete